MKVKIEVAAGISALISFLECRCHSGFGPPRSESANNFEVIYLPLPENYNTNLDSPL